MLISIVDDDVLDGPDGCKGESEIGVRTKYFLGVLELKGLKIGCTWNDPGELLCDTRADRFVTKSQAVKVTPPLALVRTHEVDEKNNGQVVVERTGSRRAYLPQSI